MTRRRGGRVAALLAASHLLGGAAAARAEEAGAEGDFEARLVAETLAERGLVALPGGDGAAAGRRIDRIVIVPVPVFTPADPVPDALNVFHVVTRRRVIRRELLFARGDAYDPAKVQETARNLRALTILTTAAAVPFRVEDEGAVGVLVVTKDLWSLRHGFVELFFDPARLADTLRVRGALTEMNLLGLNRSVALLYARNPWTWELGQSYLDRRTFGSRWALYETASVLLDDETGASARGTYQLVRPFFSLDTRWAAELTLDHDAGTSRAIEGAHVAAVRLPASPAGPPADVAHRFDRSVVAAGAAVALQLGGRLKHRLGLALRTLDRQFTPGPGVPPGREADFLDAIRLRSELSNVGEVSWSLVPTDYHRLRNADVYGRTEDFLAGPALSVAAGLSTRALASDRDFVRLAASAGWRVVTERELVASAAVSVSGRREAETLIDQALGLEFTLYSPPTGHGRVVWKSFAGLRERNRNLGIVALGGDLGLRGHPVGAVRGDSSWQSNLEWRSRPWYWMTYQLGYVVFWDAGAAWYEGDRPAPLHGVGLGGRWFLPQFNQRVLRLDLAAPADRPEAFRFVFSFDQAF